MDLKYIEEYLDQFNNWEKAPNRELKLDTMRVLCEQFGHPEDYCPCVHVAGSKGKGSVVTMLGSIVETAGFKVGLYRSPHVQHFAERISEPSGPFDAKVYRTAFEELKTGVEKVQKEHPKLELTWFELSTMLAFLVFRAAKCDFAVYEVGLGGRLDATNVVSPVCTIITLIEREHTKFLGNTLEKIAEEKAGILKEGVPVIVGPQLRDSVFKVFQREAARAHTGQMMIMPFHPQDWAEVERPIYSLGKDGRMKMQLILRQVEAELQMLGDFQFFNATMACMAARIIAPVLEIPEFSRRVLRDGLEKAYLPGRFEIVPERELPFSIPYLVLEGAHTPQSVQGAMRTLREFKYLLAGEPMIEEPEDLELLGKSPILLFGCAEDKNVEEMVAEIQGGFSEVILTRPGDFKKSDLRAMKKVFSDYDAEVTAEEDFKKAISLAFSRAEETGRGLVVMGSFYLVGEVKDFLEN